jgi:DNA-binding CsgD family transcriptional regulator
MDRLARNMDRLARKADHLPIRPDHFATRPDRVAFAAECVGIKGHWPTIKAECFEIGPDQFATRAAPQPIRADRSAIRSASFAIQSASFPIHASTFLSRPSRSAIQASNFVIRADHFLIATARPVIGADKFTIQSDRFALCMNGFLLCSIATKRNDLERQGLTREREVLCFLADGKTTVEIARRLGLSVKTVQGYCARVKQKVGAQNFTQLIRSAFLLCNADMAVRFNEWLNGVGSIEMRYFDLQGKLIATQHLKCSVPPQLSPRRKKRNLSPG